MNSSYSLILAAGLLGGFVYTTPSYGADVKLVTKIKVAFLGIGVGKMNSTISVADSQYSISGLVKTSGMVTVVSKTKATFASAGKISGKRLIPHGHNMKYKSNKKRGSLRLSFAGGNVTKTSAVPAIKYKAGSVPVDGSHMKSVLDPVSALLFPVEASGVGNGRSVCNRTLPVFDGKARMNLVFSYKSKAVRKAKGFKGMTFTCSVRYQPVAGIRPHKKNIKFMKANRDMSVTVARVGDSNLYALFGFYVRTSKGVASGSAARFALQ
ncbi:MAG: DUF3108 domain-containing protein [Rhizobiaceae bacterium]